MLPMRTSRPRWRRLRSAASVAFGVARGTDHVEREVGAAAGGLAERSRVRGDVAPERDRNDPALAERDEAREGFRIAARRDDALGAEGEREEARSASRTRRSRRRRPPFPRREPTTKEAAVRHEVAHGRRELGRARGRRGRRSA